MALTELEREEAAVRLTLNVFLRLALVMLLVVACFVVLRPFLIILVWAP